MERWVIRDLDRYKEKFEKYNEEKAIGSCAMSMAKILNGLSEMEYTLFHRHEKKMLWRAVRVFSSQCLEQIDEAFVCGDAVEKKAIIDDIEKSISEVANVCRNILDGTADVERQTVQSLSLDASMYDLSPKLCSFYSAILNRVVEMLQEADKEYAFVMNPTIRSTIETELLLQNRKKSGKVVVVHIPEGTMEQFELVPICLVHEAFHVITKRERQRKRRAKCLMLHMIEYMEDFLFRDVKFDGDEDAEIRKRLMEHWFRKGIAWLVEIASRDEEDRSFYGKLIQEEITNKITNCIVHINDDLEEIMAKTIFGELKENNYFEYHERLKKRSQIISQIRKNIFSIITINQVSAVVKELMFMYRETYADLACILMLELTPEQYNNAFSKSVRFKYDAEQYYDMDREIREELVMKTVSQFLPENQKAKWEEGINQIISERDGHYDGKCDTLMLYSQDAEIFEGYLLECGKGLLRMLNKIVGIESFRRDVRGILDNQSQEELLLRILTGNVINGMGGAQNENG